MSSKDHRRRDDRRDGRREKRAVEDARDTRESRESREGYESRETVPWSEWTWSSEHNTYYRHRLDPMTRQPAYEYNTQPGVPSQWSTYVGASSGQRQQQWNATSVSGRQDWDRQNHQPAPPPPWTNDVHQPSHHVVQQTYASPERTGPPARPVVSELPYETSAAGGGRGRDAWDTQNQNPRQGEKRDYFVPGEGIDREVITTDICRYLDNNALVRPGNYKDPRTGVIRSGYIITASSTLTPEHIADLKADTQKWHEERRSRTDVYSNSQVHDSRRYYGPSSVSAVDTVAMITSPYQAIGADPGPIQVAHIPTAADVQIPSSQQPPGSNPIYPATTAKNQFSQPQNYTITTGNYYTSDAYNPAGQEQESTQSMQSVQTPQAFQPRSSGQIDSHVTGASTSKYAQVPDEYGAIIDNARSQFITTARSHKPAGGHAQPKVSTRTAAAVRGGSAKRQKSHDPDEMDISE